MSLILENDSIRLHILHPVEDAARLGVRYVHGGYVWQAETASGATLFSGPRFHRPEPPPFHGQGAPEAFRWFELLTERRLNLHNGVGLCPGLGLIQDIGELEPKLLEAAPWRIEMEADRCTMSSNARHQRQGYELTRELQLDGFGFHSRTRIRNTGEESLEIHWFPHPFFPLAEVSRLSIPGYTLPAESEGYETLSDGSILVAKAREIPWGIFQMLEGGPGCGADIRVTHPVTGSIRFRSDAACAYLPVWASKFTVSPEPHLTAPLQPGQEAAWGLEYDFSPESDEGQRW